ncbi:capsule polysaccharide export protein [Altererythrobacter sp. B11]|nr:capsule polysaccharide export protein [Altererythrobacter sp. B11]
MRSPEKPSASGLGILLQSAGFANAGEEVFTAKAFAESRDALRALNTNDAYRKAYTRPEISIFDRFNPFGWGGSFEDLFSYFSSHVQINADPTTSISTLTVRAYSAQDAYWINRKLLQMSEATVNNLNERGQGDLVRYATVEVEAAKKDAEQASLALARLRNRSGIVDPEKQAEAQLQMISKLQDELIASKTQLAQLKAFTPENPQIPTLQERVRAIQGEINEQSGLLVGKRSSLASSAVEFQRRMLENQLAEKQLSSALAALADAKNEARRQQVYVERIVDPNLPDEPIEPRRLRGILATLAIGFAAWGILAMLIAGVREHGN